MCLSQFYHFLDLRLNIDLMTDSKSYFFVSTWEEAEGKARSVAVLDVGMATVRLLPKRTSQFLCSAPAAPVESR